MDFSGVPRAVKKRVLTARGEKPAADGNGAGEQLPGFRVSKGRLFSLTPRPAAQAGGSKTSDTAKVPHACSDASARGMKHGLSSPGTAADAATYVAAELAP